MEANARRPARHDFYQSKEWAACRRWAMRNLARRCGSCQATGGRLTLDHKTALQDAPERATDHSNLWYLCSGCHAAKTAQEGSQRRSGQG